MSLANGLNFCGPTILRQLLMSLYFSLKAMRMRKSTSATTQNVPDLLVTSLERHRKTTISHVYALPVLVDSSWFVM